MTFISNTLIIPVDNSIDRCYIYNMMRNTRNTKNGENKMKNDKEIIIRACAFTGTGVRTHRALVEADGTVSVWDAVAGHYTSCHCLCDSAIQRARRIAD
jgi:hypothetical protein